MSTILLFVRRNLTERVDRMAIRDGLTVPCIRASQGKHQKADAGMIEESEEPFSARHAKEIREASAAAAASSKE